MCTGRPEGCGRGVSPNNYVTIYSPGVILSVPDKDKPLFYDDKKHDRLMKTSKPSGT